jgi:flagellar basal body rod protein FlgG
VLRGIYSAAGGLNAASQQQDSIAHNLAHAMKPGYRREIVRFDSYAPVEQLQGPATSVHTDFVPGVQEFTGNVLDVALNGPGFFSILGPSGPLYTRSGVFQLNSQGQLVTQDGLPVEGTAGPIALPQGAGRIEILPDGVVVADGNQVDQIKVVAFQNMQDMQRVGSSFFQPTPNASLSLTLPEVRQMYRENGNTTLVSEMVQMISGARLFEASQKALTQMSETISLNTRPS